MVQQTVWSNIKCVWFRSTYRGGGSTTFPASWGSPVTPQKPQSLISRRQRGHKTIFALPPLFIVALTATTASFCSPSSGLSAEIFVTFFLLAATVLLAGTVWACSSSCCWCRAATCGCHSASSRRFRGLREVTRLCCCWATSIIRFAGGTGAFLDAGFTRLIFSTRMCISGFLK